MNRVHNGALRGASRIGWPGYDRERWQWQPVLDAHDPSPPITLEDAAAGGMVSAVAESAGSGVAQAVGASIAAAAASSTGTSTAIAAGAALVGAVVSSTGSSTAAGTGAAIAAAEMNAAGVSGADAVGVGVAGGTIEAGAGSSDGASTVTAEGASTVTAEVLSTASSTASAVGETVDVSAPEPEAEPKVIPDGGGAIGRNNPWAEQRRRIELELKIEDENLLEFAYIAVQQLARDHMNRQALAQR